MRFLPYMFRDATATFISLLVLFFVFKIFYEKMSLKNSRMLSKWVWNVLIYVLEAISKCGLALISLHYFKAQFLWVKFYKQ